MIQLTFYVKANVLRENNRTLKRSVKSSTYYNAYFHTWLTECLKQKLLAEVSCPHTFTFQGLQIKFKNKTFCKFTINLDCPDLREITLSNVYTGLFHHGYVKEVYRCLESVTLDNSLAIEGREILDVSYKLQTHTYIFCLYGQSIREIQFSLFDPHTFEFF